MKKILLAALFIFGATGLAQAAFIDGETAGTSKHNVTGFGLNDAFVAQGQVGSTTVSLTDVGTSVASSTSLNTDGVADGFVHDFIFQAVQDTFVSVSTSIQLTGGQPGQCITPLVMEIWHILAGADVLLASASIDSGANPAAEEFVSLTQNETYVVRMSNCNAGATADVACDSPGTIGQNADYTLNVLTPVPVPAAVWLFGTAMMGLFGLRRKSRMAAAA